jgi:hypothetical protein
MLSAELSELKVTSIVPVEEVTAAGIDVPEKLPSSIAEVVLPLYTFTMSYSPSVSNAENVSVTAEPVWMSHWHCVFEA